MERDSVGGKEESRGGMAEWQIQERRRRDCL